MVSTAGTSCEAPGYWITARRCVDRTNRSNLFERAVSVASLSEADFGAVTARVYQGC
jgi:hypothetical protein